MQEIRLHIQQFYDEDNKEVYYVVTSPDVEWLVVEAFSIDEAVKIGKEMVEELLKEQGRSSLLKKIFLQATLSV